MAYGTPSLNRPLLSLLQPSSVFEGCSREVRIALAPTTNAWPKSMPRILILLGSQPQSRAMSCLVETTFLISVKKIVCAANSGCKTTRQLVRGQSSVLDRMELIQLESKHLEPEPICLNRPSQNIAFPGVGSRFEVVVSDTLDMTPHLLHRH
ncbi:MAG: hypothetical protein J3R72DRAFT_101274 [Linnemannia gamsii]|nr:MAG: hypothetical protein J3R72DRAFT_101274 [Linnemannia gamsii]